MYRRLPQNELDKRVIRNEFLRSIKHHFRAENWIEVECLMHLYEEGWLDDSLFEAQIKLLLYA